ncbi:MAG: OPT/YSL family transporter, partial [Planctomycetota bacterium]
MALKQLTQEQIRTMTVEEKDRWWLENVYQGDVPQFTLRAVAGGFLLGGVLSITNLYIGARTGWTLGVAITAVILAFVMFKLMSRIGMGRDYHVLESNILQSIACNAGYMNGPLIASMAAYMMITNTVIPWWQMIMWLLGLNLLGVFIAFPMKRRYINADQLPFPEGRAAGVVMDTLHSSGEQGRSKSLLPAKLLVISCVGAGLLKLFQSQSVMEKLKIKILTIPEMLDTWYYELALRVNIWFPSILGTPLKELSVRPELDIAMMGAGGLMGIGTGLSLMVGAIINYCVLAPIMIQAGDIAVTVDAAGVSHVGFRAITTWALWCGVSMMTTASLLSFLAKPQMIMSAFSGLSGKKNSQKDPIGHIELPIKISVVGVLVVGAYVVFIAHWFFDVEYWMAAIAIPMVFVFALIGVNSTALTSIMPTGALGKLT